MEAILLMSRSDFKDQLTDTITNGNKLFGKDIDYKNFLTFKDEYSLWDDYNFHFLNNAFEGHYNHIAKDYKSITHNALSYKRHNRPDEVTIEKELLKKKLSYLNFLLANCHSFINIDEKKMIDTNNQTTDKSKVFIVHGHDELAKITVESFIKDLGFEPIILHKQASSGKTIIEKIEAYTDVGFGIILYTPCDIGSKNLKPFELKPRARQNVVFEHGYLIGKIGRGNVCAIVKDDVEIQNDISGIVYVQMIGQWKIDLAKELKSSGYNVDMNNVIK